VISADGKTIAFESYATNLVGGDSNGSRDVFVWQESTGKIVRVSETADGIEGNAESYEPSMSATGAVIAFTSNASNLAAGAKGTSTANVFVKDMNTNKIRILSLDPKNKSGVGGSNPSVSYSGELIAFYSFASTLVDKDENGLWDIFVWESGNPKLKKLSFHPTGADKEQGNESSSRVVAPSISGNGKYVAFATTANNLVQGDGNRSQDAFVVEIETNRTIRVSQGPDGIEGDSDSPIKQGEKVAISYDGQWIAFSTVSKNLGGNVLLRNWVTNETKIISKGIGATVGEPAISAFGNYVVFGTSQRLDSKFQSSGIFGIYTGLSGCRFCPQQN
jgi:Tol biopolymer transport system component